MLRRIIALKNVGRFRNGVAAPNPMFAKHTLIFGGNGFGKTTFCTVMRSLQCGDAAPIQGRHTLGASDGSEIDILFPGGNRRYRDGAWNTTEPKISIFDGAFVAANVHSGDLVDVTHRRNLYQVIIGRNGVGLAEKEKTLAEEARATQGELSAAERSVGVLCPQGMSIRNYLELADEPEIETKIEAQRQIVHALTQAHFIHSRAPLTPVEMPTIPAALVPLLGKSIDGVAADAEARLVSHLSRHGMQEHGERWISEGMATVVDDSCPFCGRSGLLSLDLIKSYRAHFSEAYNSLQEELSALRAEVERAFGPVAQGQLRTEIERNVGAIEFWRHHCPLPPDGLPSADAAITRLQDAHSELVTILSRKGAALLQPISAPPELGRANEILVATGALISVYNASCAAANVQIATLKAAAAGGELASAQAELSRLVALKRRHEASTVEACGRYVRLDAEKRRLEREKAEVRERLEAHTEQVIQPYETRINHYLGLFNAGFTIARTSHAYPGGIATSTYQLIIADTAVDLGDGRTPIDRPSFKNTLSAGDRATLALAFFLAHLEREPDLAERVVIFDDPFSSQDGFRRHQTIYEIMRAAKTCAQTIVLSHDANFLQQLWQKCPPSDRTAMQIIHHPTTGSQLFAFDLGDACRGRARAELDDLMGFRATGAGNLREIIKKLRIVLETFFVSNFPGSFFPDDNLGGILGKIRVGGDQHPARGHYETLDRINDYSAIYHHGEDPADAAEPPLDRQELMGFVNITLRTVNALTA